MGRTSSCDASSPATARTDAALRWSGCPGERVSTAGQVRAGAVVLDVRPEAEYAAGHIAGGGVRSAGPC